VQELRAQFDGQWSVGVGYGVDTTANPRSRFKHDYTYALLAEIPRRRQPSDSSADDHDIGA
jgi:hypothetical protein